MKKKSLYRKRRSVKRSKYSPRRSSVSVAVKKYVNRTIHSNIENKCAQVQWSQSLGGATGSSTLYAFPMTPYAGYMSISPTVLQNGRVGNTIKTRKLTFNFVMSPLQYNATTNPYPTPLEVQMIFGYAKDDSAVIPTPTDITNLFQAGSSSSAPTGLLTDLCLDFNKDAWHISKVMKFKLGYGSFNASPGGQANLGYTTNNDFKLNVVKRINLTKYCPKTIKFNDSTTLPQNKGLFCMINVLNALGNSVIPVNQLVCRIDGYVNYEYEDA